MEISHGIGCGFEILSQRRVGINPQASVARSKKISASSGQTGGGLLIPFFVSFIQ
jgi:hypothetical protein